MKLFIYPYIAGSKSAGLLAKELNTRRLKRVGSTVRDTADVTIINWGSGSVPFRNAKIINNPSKVSVSANKLKTFQELSKYNEVNIPEYTTSIETARSWIVDKKYRVAVRSVLNGNSGAGLSIATHVDELTRAPLYVRYVPKSGEYRVHVIDGAVVRVQKKVLRKGDQPKNGEWAIRNHENGFIFQIANQKDIPHRSILDQAVAAVKHLGLDFGGVDVIWNDKSRKAYVLEVNTAPGIEGGTVSIYANSFRDMTRDG